MKEALVGQHVRVPWEFDFLEGTIKELYGPPGRPFALVAVQLPNDGVGEPEEHTVSVPLEALELVEDSHPRA